MRCELSEIVMMRKVPKLYTYILKQDDPRKCTSNKLVRFGYTKKILKRTAIHKQSIVLNPSSESILTIQDRSLALKKGIIAIDCSWINATQLFLNIHRGNHRRLPLLLAGNPTSYAKIGKLTSLEALAAALIILSFTENALTLLRLYKWGTTFLKLNHELLESYRNCNYQEEIVELEEQIFFKNKNL
jgi:pre-rRNA-processing protein TSR3